MDTKQQRKQQFQTHVFSIGSNQEVQELGEGSLSDKIPTSHSILQTEKVQKRVRINYNCDSAAAVQVSNLSERKVLIISQHCHGTVILGVH